MVDCGAVPNNSSKTVATGITNIDKVVGLKFNYTSTSVAFEDDWTDMNGNRFRHYYSYQTNVIAIETNYNPSGAVGYVIMEYTKTTS